MLGIIIVLLVLALSFGYWYKRDRNLPPGPRGLPVVGVIPFMGCSPPVAIRNWSKKYGNVFAMRMGQRDYIVLGDYEAYNEVYLKQSQSVDARPDLFIFDSLTETLGVLFANQRVWHVHRPFTALTLRRLGMGKKAIEIKVQEEVNYLINAFHGKDEKPFNCKDLLLFTTTNIISKVLLGERFDYDDEYFQKLARHAWRGLQDPFDGPLLQLMCYSKTLRYFPPYRGAYKRFKEDYEYLYGIFGEKINQHKLTYDENEIRDFIDAFIAETKKENVDATFHDKQLMVTLKDLYDGGTQTSSTALLWSILILAKYPEYQTKIQEEIESTLNTNGSVTMNERHLMPYTLAFIYEVMRRCTLIPFSSVKATQDIEVRGLHIPKGTEVLGSIWAVHNSPQYYDNPSEFKPERFISPKDGSFVKPKHWIPFSIGPRNCVGEQLAQVEIFTLLVKIIQNFNIMAEDRSKLPNLDDGVYGIIYVPEEFEVKFLERVD